MTRIRKFYTYPMAVDCNKQPDAIIVQVHEGSPLPPSKHSGYWFYVGTPDAISTRVIQNGYSAFKIYEGISYLIMDIECYHPKTVVKTAELLGLTELLPSNWRDNTGTYRDVQLTQAQIKAVFLKGVREIASRLVFFASKFYDVLLTVDDIAVDESCDDADGGKLSAHLHCPKLVFSNVDLHMKHFVYYFISETFPRYDDIATPIVLFLTLRIDIPWWMRESPRVLKPDEKWEDKSIGGKRSLYYSFFDHFKNNVEWTRTCVDIAIYTRWRTLRVTGSAKNGKRILVPSNITQYWSSQLGHIRGGVQELNETNRNTWMSFMLGLRPPVSTLAHSIRPQWPKTRARPSSDRYEPFDTPNYNPTPLASQSTLCNSHDFRETWPFAHNLDRERVRAPRRMPAGLDNEFIPIKVPRRLQFLELSQLPNDESRYLLFRHLVDLHEAIGFKDFDRVGEILKDMAAVEPFVSFSISEPIQSLFADKCARVSADFEVRIPHFPDKVPLREIYFKTTIFCPVHENGDSHNPSAFVGINDETGLRFIYCCVCSIQHDGRRVMEEEPPPKTDLKDYIPHTHEIKSEFLGLQHLTLSDSAHINTIIIKAPMGSGKTTLFKTLFNEPRGLTLLKKLTRTTGVANNLIKTPILSIAPRQLLTVFLAGKFGLMDQYSVCEEVSAKRIKTDDDPYTIANRAMCQTERFSVCAGSIHRIGERDMEDQVVIMDEARMTMEFFTSDIGQKHARDSIRALQKQLQKSKLKIIMGADLDIATLCVLLPDLDLNNNSKEILCIDNKGVEGGKGGIQGLTPYYTLDFNYALQYVTHMVKETVATGNTNVYFFPTNQYEHAVFLEHLMVHHTGICRSRVFLITRRTPQTVKYALIKDCKGYMQSNGFQVIIASPVFGTGFSIDAGCITHTFGFFFTYPVGNSNWVQMLARGRGPQSLGFFAEDAGLGNKKRLTIGGRTHKVDVSWLANNVMAQLAARKESFASYVENLCAHGSTADDPYFNIMSQYIAIKKAEEEIDKNVGAYHLIEELQRVTGKECAPLSMFGKFSMTDEWKATVETHCKPTKIEKEVAKERLSSYTQDMITTMQENEENLSFEQKLDVHKLDKYLIPFSMMPEPMRSKAERNRLEMLILLLLRAPRVEYVEHNSRLHSCEGYEPIYFVSDIDRQQGILPLLCNLVALIMKSTDHTVYTMLFLEEDFFPAPIAANVHTDGLNAIIDDLRIWCGDPRDDRIGVKDIVCAARSYRSKGGDKQISRVLILTLRALGLGTWTLQDDKIRKIVYIAKPAKPADVPIRIKLAFTWYSIREKIGYAKTLVVFGVTGNRKLWYFKYFPTEHEVDSHRGSKPIQSYFYKNK